MGRFLTVSLLIVCLILVEHPLDVGSKLRQRIDHHAHPSLSNHALIALRQHARIVRLPRGDGHPGPEGCRIRHDLRSYSFVVSTAVGDEVPDHSVANSEPGAFAAATVITGLESDRCIAQRSQRVLNNVLGLERSNAFGKT